MNSWRLLVYAANTRKLFTISCTSFSLFLLNTSTLLNLVQRLLLVPAALPLIKEFEIYYCLLIIICSLWNTMLLFSGDPMTLSIYFRFWYEFLEREGFLFSIGTLTLNLEFLFISFINSDYNLWADNFFTNYSILGFVPSIVSYFLFSL